VCRDATDGANATKDFISAKDFCTYSIIILRQEKAFAIIRLNADWPRLRVAFPAIATCEGNGHAAP
jgi:hypothetical protein